MIEKRKTTLVEIHETLIKLWEYVEKEASEGHEELRVLNDELQKIEKSSYINPTIDNDVKGLLCNLEDVDATANIFDDLKSKILEDTSLIQWYPNNVYEDLNTAKEAQNYCANLIGKTRESQKNPNLFYSEDIIVGLFLLGPNSYYPEHAHPASEMWVILSGTAMWKRGAENWKTRKPGDYFIHTENEPHAMKTTDEPILALWSWVGDLDQWAKWVENE